MDAAVALTMAIAFAAGVEVIVEQFKVWALTVPFYKDRPADQQSAITQIVAFVLGILFAFGWQINLLVVAPGYAAANPQIGYLVTGLLIGLGSKFLHLLSDVVTGAKDNLNAKAAEHQANAELPVINETTGQAIYPPSQTPPAVPQSQIISS